MAVGDSLGITLISEGDTDWYDEINTNILQVMIDALEAQVPIANISVNSDLDMNTKNVTNAASTKYSTAGSTKTTSGDERKVYTYNGELYYTDSSLNAVKLTSGGSLNASATNGLTTTGSPAYGSGPEVIWDGTNSEYRFKDGAGSDDYAVIRASDLRLHDGSSHYYAIVPQSMSSNQTITLPAANPGAAALWEIDSSGNVTWQNTLAGTYEFTNDFTWGFTRNLTIPASAGHPDFASTVWDINPMHADVNVGETPSGGGDDFNIPFTLPAGFRIRECHLYVRGNTGVTITPTLYGGDISAYSTGSSISAGSASAASNTDQTLSITGLTRTVTTGEGFYMHCGLSNGTVATTTLLIYGLKVVYDKP